MNVTTITCYYFGDKYFLDLLNSLKKNIDNSNIKNHQLIIVNDSADNGQKEKLNNLVELSGIKSKSEVIIIENEVNKGVTNSRREAFKHVKSEFFHIIDQDDILDGSAFEYIINNFKEDKKIIAFDGKKVDENGNTIKIGLFKHLNKKTQQKKLNNIKAYYFGGNQIITPGMLFFKKDALMDITNIYEVLTKYGRIFDGIDDFYLNLFLLNYGYKFIYTNKFYFKYRVHSTNQRDRKKEKINQLKAYEELCQDNILKKNKMFVEKLNLILLLENKNFFKAMFKLLSFFRYLRYIYI